MLAPGERVLVAVSGARTPSRCGTSSPASGTRPTACTSAWGSATTPTSRAVTPAPSPPSGGCASSRSTCARSTASTCRGAAAVTHRSPCGACGLSKRHLFNDAAHRAGYDVVATGHNLDDEAAVLLGNVLRWETGYLGRQAPGPARRARLRAQGQAARPPGEREMAAYCVLTGSTTRSTSARWRRATATSGSRRCSTASRTARSGAKAAFLFGFYERGREHFVDGAANEREGSHPCPGCGSPTTGEHLRVLHPPGARRRPGPGAPPGRTGPGGDYRAPTVRAGRPGAPHRHQEPPPPREPRRGGQFHSHAGVLEHDEILGREEGISVRSSLGAATRGAAAHPRRVRAEDAAGRAGDLPEGPRADPRARRHLPRCPGPRVRHRARAR